MAGLIMSKTSYNCWYTVLFCLRPKIEPECKIVSHVADLLKTEYVPDPIGKLKPILVAGPHGMEGHSSHQKPAHEELRLPITSYLCDIVIYANMRITV